MLTVNSIKTSRTRAKTCLILLGKQFRSVTQPRDKRDTESRAVRIIWPACKPVHILYIKRLHSRVRSQSALNPPKSLGIPHGPLSQERHSSFGSPAAKSTWFWEACTHLASGQRMLLLPARVRPVLGYSRASCALTLRERFRV